MRERVREPKWTEISNLGLYSMLGFYVLGAVYGWDFLPRGYLLAMGWFAFVVFGLLAVIGVVLLVWEKSLQRKLDALHLGGPTDG